MPASTVPISSRKKTGATKANSTAAEPWLLARSRRQKSKSFVTVSVLVASISRSEGRQNEAEEEFLTNARLSVPLEM